MEYEHLSYIKDKKGVIYQIYGVIQPKDRLLVQVSYVPEKFVQEKYKKRCKKRVINGENYIKWTPLVDILGPNSYAKATIDMLNNLKMSKFSKQVMELRTNNIKEYFPPMSIKDLKFDKKTTNMLNSILKEFTLDTKKVMLGGLTKIILKEHNKNLLNYLVKSDLDFYVYSKKKSRIVKKILNNLRKNEPHRFITKRGLTGEIIPHRITCSHKGKNFDIDFLFSPKKEEEYPFFRYLEINYNSIELVSLENNIKPLAIISDDSGFSFPQLFNIKCNIDKINLMICYSHRYDFIYKGNFEIKNYKIMKIKDKKFIVLDNYGSLNGHQTEELRK